jgi:threonine/homoserine/homoserine lactone efflux protein
MMAMTYAQNLWIYFVLLFGIIIVPGMDMFFVMANALIGGRLRGLAATAGIMLGGIFHTIFGAFFVGVISQLAPLVLQLILLASASTWRGLDTRCCAAPSQCRQSGIAAQVT